MEAALTAIMPAAAAATTSTILSVAGTGLSILGSINSGRAQNQAANYQARQMEQQAGQQRAASQRAAIEERRKSRLVQSRLQAVAGASGAGALDPTVVDISSDLAGEGEYRALTALYDGEQRARGLQDSAATKRYEGKLAKTAGYMNAGGTLMADASTLFDKYGKGGPSTVAGAFDPSEYGPYELPWRTGQ